MDYKEKLKLAKEALESGSYDKETIEYIFPELMESEDEGERIRKAITEFFKNYSENGTWKAIPDVTKWIAWLEAQGTPAKLSEEERKVVEYNSPELKESEDERIRKSLSAYFAQFKPDDMWDDDFSFGDILAWIEKQGEQKDVCINIKDNQELPNKEETEVSDEYQQGYRDGFKCGKEYVEKYPQEFNLQPMQLIQECEHENLIKERLINAVNICYTEDGGKEAPFKEELIAYINKHCEWSKKDEEIIQNIINLLEEPNTIDESSYTDIAIYWLKLLKESCVPQPKQEWSEWDRVLQDSSISYLCNLRDAFETKKWDKEQIQKCISWLQSIRPQNRWKPSDEMLEALYRVIPENVMEKSENEILLDKLYQGLKYGRVLSNN